MKSWTTGLDELVQCGNWPATINHQTIFHVDLFQSLPATINHQTIFHVDLFQSLPATINHQTIFHVDLFQSLPATINHQTIFHVDLFQSFQDLKQLAPGLSRHACIGMLDERTVFWQSKELWRRQNSAAGWRSFSCFSLHIKVPESIEVQGAPGLTSPVTRHEHY
ncbi:uncharacterized protein LOC143484957 [Brachyhypopomus gauderio]|uniref:uncharacterized protein LOC143484957 n=1 Tax=Brachyhypopomus gauderio TaxID=698409 RepID=UPI00404179C7